MSTRARKPVSMGHAFLRDVLEHPDDDAPRLIYADWLEDHGDPERAEFIRLDVELAGRVDDARRAALQKRREALLDMRRPVVSGLSARLVSNAWWWVGPAVARAVQADFLFRRGFVHSISLSAESFREHAKLLFSSHPVQEVTLDSVSPVMRAARGVTSYCWLPGRGWSRFGPYGPGVPPSVFCLLKGTPCPDPNRRAYPDRAAALADLSRALVLHGRKEAGLLP